MYNLHCHSLLSDGCLLPSEIAVRYAAVGFKAIAITDHADYSNIKPTISAIVEFCSKWPKNAGIKVIPGIELTHLPLEQFKALAKYARSKGIKIIVGHGETPAEPIIRGTNSAALAADIDVLAHPGFISEEDISLAKKRGIFLEITTRSGHSEANSHVMKGALRLGARLVLNTDSHLPEDIISPDAVIQNALSLGLSHDQINAIYKDVGNFLRRL